VWYSMYWFQLTMTMLTASISMLTALIFSPVIDRLLHERSPSLYEAHRKLEAPHSPYIEQLNELLRREGLQ